MNSSFEPTHLTFLGFYVTGSGSVDTLSIATLGYLTQDVDDVNLIFLGKVCLYLLQKREIPQVSIKVSVSPKIEVRKRNSANINLYVSSSPTIVINKQVSPSIGMKHRNKPNIVIYTNNCPEELN
jgi:hypothetical protein